MDMINIDDEYARKKCYESELLGGSGTEESTDITYFDCEVIGASCTSAVKLTVTIVSTKFEGLALLKRHRLMNAIFASELKDNSVHALTVKAYTPTQWESKK
mmetsp:Transcript_3947/g.4277  ORF Transcript_3947/g.4277 Transcript_3947/m.4277 type:complete len:102 (+) Transcript_3947:219-524(+)